MRVYVDATVLITLGSVGELPFLNSPDGEVTVLLRPKIHIIKAVGGWFVGQ
jgi:hypothetical protein